MEQKCDSRTQIGSVVAIHRHPEPKLDSCILLQLIKLHHIPMVPTVWHDRCDRVREEKNALAEQ